MFTQFFEEDPQRKKDTENEDEDDDYHGDDDGDDDEDDDSFFQPPFNSTSNDWNLHLSDSTLPPENSHSFGGISNNASSSTAADDFNIGSYMSEPNGRNSRDRSARSSRRGSPRRTPQRSRQQSRQASPIPGPSNYSTARSCIRLRPEDLSSALSGKVPNQMLMMLHPRPTKKIYTTCN